MKAMKETTLSKPMMSISCKLYQLGLVKLQVVDSLPEMMKPAILLEGNGNMQSRDYPG